MSRVDRIELTMGSFIADVDGDYVLPPGRYEITFQYRVCQTTTEGYIEHPCRIKELEHHPSSGIIKVKKLKDFQ